MSNLPLDEIEQFLSRLHLHLSEPLDVETSTTLHMTAQQLVSEVKRLREENNESRPSLPQVVIDNLRCARQAISRLRQPEDACAAARENGFISGTLYTLAAYDYRLFEEGRRIVEEEAETQRILREEVPK